MVNTACDTSIESFVSAYAKVQGKVLREALRALSELESVSRCGRVENMQRPSGKWG